MQNKNDEKEEYVYKFRCEHCNKLVGGIKKDGYIIFFKGAARHSIDGKKTKFLCSCKKENIYDLEKIRKKIFDMNLKAVLESSAKNQEEKTKN